MTLRSKVAAALAITLLAIPTGVLASCWLHTPATQANDCQMMSKRPVAASIQNAMADPACCELSSGKAAPASVVQEPGATADEVTPASSVTGTNVLKPTGEAGPAGPSVRPSGPTLQAVLCVFLI
jgi:hypothetical protein